MEKGAGAEKWMDYYNIHPRPSPLSLLHLFTIHLVPLSGYNIWSRSDWCGMEWSGVARIHQWYIDGRDTNIVIHFFYINGRDTIIVIHFFSMVTII